MDFGCVCVCISVCVCICGVSYGGGRLVSIYPPFSPPPPRPVHLTQPILDAHHPRPPSPLNQLSQQEPQRSLLLCKLRCLAAPPLITTITRTTTITTTDASNNTTTVGAGAPEEAKEAEEEEGEMHTAVTASSRQPSCPLPLPLPAARVSFPCLLHHPSSSSSSSRLRLARAVLCRAVGGGDESEEGKGGLKPDVFRELVAYCRPAWDPALCGGGGR